MSFLNQLDKLKQTGSSKWVACCPVHNEKSPSLSIKQLNDSSYLCHCFGCGANGLEVFKALGADLDELFGGKDYERQPITREMRETLEFDKQIVKAYESVIESEKKPNLKEHRMYKLSKERIKGIEAKL